ncbi:unnamed protein product, partial [Closterium sp. NIES-54]
MLGYHNRKQPGQGSEQSITLDHSLLSSDIAAPLSDDGVNSRSSVFDVQACWQPYLPPPAFSHVSHISVVGRSDSICALSLRFRVVRPLLAPRLAASRLIVDLSLDIAIACRMGPDDKVRDTRSQSLSNVARPIPTAVARCLDRVRQSLQVTFKDFVADGRQCKNSDASDAVDDSCGLVQIRCRDAQRDQIVAFCRDHATTARAGSLYVCGCPGTGKTLMLSQVAKEVSTWTNAAGELLCVPVYVNCMALTDPANLFPQ